MESCQGYIIKLTSPFHTNAINMYALWFKVILCLMFLELVSILFATVPGYGNEYMTKENKNLTSFEHFCTKTKFKPQNTVYMH